MIPFLVDATLSKADNIRHGFFTRHGGVSEGVYASLNSARGTGDAPEHVDENYRRIAATLNAKTIAKAHQIHSATAVIATGEWQGALPEADAVVTNTPGVAVAVTTADCVPLLLADTEARVVAAVHAGWKGALGGVIEEAINTMETLGAEQYRLTAAIGPCIQQASYEVGPEFHARFVEQSEDYQAFFAPALKAGHYLFDLPGLVRFRLRLAQVPVINSLARDTCSGENEFFSYRRATLNGQSRYGCQLSAIMIEP